MPDRILLIGDAQQEMRTALLQAMPHAQVTDAINVFDGIAELCDRPFDAVIAAAEPIERRPESAVQTLRELAGTGRLVLYGHPTLEPLARKMLNFGIDDYLVTPPSVDDLQAALGGVSMRLADGHHPAELVLDVPKSTVFESLPVTESVLDALLNHPADPVAAAVDRLNVALPETIRLTLIPAEAGVPVGDLGRVIVDEAGSKRAIQLHLDDEAHLESASQFLDTFVGHLGKLATLQDRHNGLQKLAITDELTGLYNGRYFRHYLERIIAKARDLMFPVTLLLFDIDNFKKYNDQYGHGVGDEILRQTAALMKQCVRDHDLVARISGDEFAVVFWEKEGPRQPREGAVGAPGRPPQTPVQILERFRRSLAAELFKGLGPSGQGTLTISGGLAVFPYHANSVPELIDAADKALMFKAKQSGKNSIYLVGGAEPTNGEVISPRQTP